MLPLVRLALALALLAPAAAFAEERSSEPDTSRVFDLGVVDVVGLRPRGAAALEEQVAGPDLREIGREDYARALEDVPGLAITTGGSRNEAGLYLRGFDLRQVPLFVDGIPVYVPYDGYVDLARFTTFDASAITVSKGFSSVLYGPNALGGAINVVSRRPASALEVSGGTSVLTGDGYSGDLAVGSRHAGWYAQASGSWLKQDAYPLASGYAPVAAQPAGDRVNARREDWRAGVKLGLTPRGTDEYALVFATQQGEKGNPPYTGTQPGVRVRYWRWPQWDKDDVYLITQTALGWGSLLKGRLYYDRFKNELDSYDDATFTTQLRKSSFRSYYDDPTAGGSLEWSLPAGARQTLRTAFHGKYDRHQEHNAGEPERKVEDLTLSWAGEDTWRLTEAVTGVAGVSWSRRRGLSADDFQNGVLFDQPTASNSAWNGEAALLWDVARGTLRGSVARRTRFATMKDRFSYKMGTAIPNPGLRPETALHWELAYAGAPLTGFKTRVAVFYSRIADLIEPVDAVAVVDSVPVSQTRNVGDARSAGFEVGFDATPVRALGVGAAWSYVDRKNLDHPEIVPIETPRSSVAAYAQVAPLRWLDVRGSVFGYGRRYATSTGLVALAPFATVELRASAMLRPGTSFEAGVSNLLDAAYALDEGYPEPGRTFFAGMRFGLTR